MHNSYFSQHSVVTTKAMERWIYINMHIYIYIYILLYIMREGEKYIYIILVEIVIKDQYYQSTCTVASGLF